MKSLEGRSHGIFFFDELFEKEQEFGLEGETR